MTAADLIASIYARCRPDGDCMLWTGPVTHSGMPRATLFGVRNVLIRRKLYAAQHGEVPEGRLVTPQCGHKLCLAEHHLAALTPADSKAIAARRGAYKSQARVIRRTLTLRANSHITEEVVEQVRGAPDAKTAHLQTGVSLAYCYELRSGARRMPIAHSPFAGLGARA
jgi:hypothetical protein